jgi:hypothetical protein
MTRLDNWSRAAALTGVASTVLVVIGALLGVPQGTRPPARW